MLLSITLKRSKKKEIPVLTNSRNKLNAINFAYIAKLGLKVKKIDVDVQKIDSSFLKT